MSCVIDIVVCDVSDHESPLFRPKQLQCCGLFSDPKNTKDDILQFSCIDAFGAECIYFEGMVNEYPKNRIICNSDYSRSSGVNKASQPDIQSLTYRIFDLIEPALKQAIAQAIEEHLGQ